MYRHIQDLLEDCDRKRPETLVVLTYAMLVLVEQHLQKNIRYFKWESVKKMFCQRLDFVHVVDKCKFNF